MKKMKIVLMLVVAAFLIMSVAACSQNEPAPSTGRTGGIESSSTTDTNATTDDTTVADDTTETTDAPETGGTPAVAVDGEAFNIGIVSRSDHPALMATQDGFIAALEHYGVPANYDIQNALGDVDLLPSIADRFIGNDVDLIFAIATASLQAMFNATDDIPIVASAISSFEAAGVVDSDEEPGYNATGSSDMNPIPSQIELIREFVPNMQTLGIAYTSSEANSVVQAEIAQKYAESIGLNVVVSTITTVGEVQQNMLSLASSVDAIWIPTDNTHADAMPIVGDVSIETGVPAFAGENQMTMGGGLATLSINYFTLGYEAGRMARDILVHGHDPAEMPIRFGMDLQLDYIVNGFIAQEMGIEIPERLMEYVWFPE
jgi:putative ABC transport system substrate-binding protein